MTYTLLDIILMSDSPKKATRRGVRVAVKGGVLRPQQEGEDSSGACTEGVPNNHQPVVHGAFILQETDTVIALTHTHFCHHSELNKCLHTAGTKLCVGLRSCCEDAGLV